LCFEVMEIEWDNWGVHLLFILSPNGSTYLCMYYIKFLVRIRPRLSRTRRFRV
jgi:hypothetical protein